jgi:predicted neutral ceramidase superfamily lipid hydrolase
MLCIAVQGKWNKLIRGGIYLMAASLWFSSVGSAIVRFGAAEGAIALPGFAEGVVGIVVLVSIFTALTLLIVGGYRKKRFVSLAIPAIITLLLLLIVPIITPSEYSGITSLVTNLTMLGFTALLGLYLFIGKFDNDKNATTNYS